MSDRIHRWLDGELDLENLSTEERERAGRLQAALDEASRASRRSSPGMAGPVMARIAASPAPARRSLRDRVRSALSGRTPGLRPAAALVAASLAIGFGLGLWMAPDAPESGTAASVETAGVESATGTDVPTVFVRFDLRVEEATSVRLAGSFSGWEPRYELSEAGDGHWTVTIALKPGVHDYVFVVDGEHQVLDPAAPQIADGFGSFNNRIALLASST